MRCFAYGRSSSGGGLARSIFPDRASMCRRGGGEPVQPSKPLGVRALSSARWPQQPGHWRAPRPAFQSRHQWHVRMADWGSLGRSGDAPSRPAPWRRCAAPARSSRHATLDPNRWRRPEAQFACLVAAAPVKCALSPVKCALSIVQVLHAVLHAFPPLRRVLKRIALTARGAPAPPFVDRCRR